MAQVKGTAVQSSMRYVRERFGEEALAKILDALPEGDRAPLASVLASSWCPMGAFLRFMQEAKGQLGGREPDVLRNMGRASAEYGVTGVYKIFFKVGSPEFIISRATRVFSSYYDTGQHHGRREPERPHRRRGDRPRGLGPRVLRAHPRLDAPHARAGGGEGPSLGPLAVRPPRGPDVPFRGKLGVDESRPRGPLLRRPRRDGRPRPRVHPRDPRRAAARARDVLARRGHDDGLREGDRRGRLLPRRSHRRTLRRRPRRLALRHVAAARDDRAPRPPPRRARRRGQPLLDGNHPLRRPRRDVVPAAAADPPRPRVRARNALRLPALRVLPQRRAREPDVPVHPVPRSAVPPGRGHAARGRGRPRAGGRRRQLAWRKGSASSTTRSSRAFCSSPPPRSAGSAPAARRSRGVRRRRS